MRKKTSQKIINALKLAKKGDPRAIQTIGKAIERVSKDDTGDDPEGLCEQALLALLGYEEEVIVSMALAYLSGNIIIRERNLMVLEAFIQNPKNSSVIISLIGAIKK